ncbi:hypothetical protein BT67DRAFT_130820 [Trichocladium antarcticum]|uniref:LIM zinc-binding domain-containing protein n=1 Tax=Trichocladium antarcticum TaxID=1450529 RepID=A0AAN6ZHT2_9PEZI|nr:hypothetical protein BT67DRAFT_130820 [Trichocladium antarcticum]
MTEVGNEPSSFVPTVKCSTCGLEVEISLMGEHDCAGSPVVDATPPTPAASLFGRLMPSFNNPSTQKQQPRALPQVDTSAASTRSAVSDLMLTADNGPDRAYMGQEELTPISLSSGSQPSVSPLTPNVRPGAGKADEYFAPQIANDSPPPLQPRRPTGSGYGGLGGHEDPAFPPNTSKTQAPEPMERIRDITPAPLDPSRRPPAAARGGLNDANDRPGTSASSASSLGSSLGSGKAPKAPRHNGYGSFGPPSRAPGSVGGLPTTPSRSETFPRPSNSFAPPQRTPSAPPSSATLRPDRLRPTLTSPGDPDGRVSMTGERPGRPSRGPETPRGPPPRTGLLRPKTPVVPTINLAEEFGIGNPYHTSSDSTSSSATEHSQPERRPSQASQTSQASSRTSPPRSLSSRSGRNPSDTSSFDNLMSDIQSSMDEMKTKPPLIAPLKVPPRDPRDRSSPLIARPPRSADAGHDRGGYDPRIDPAIQNPRSARGRSPLPSPMANTPAGGGLTVQIPEEPIAPESAGPPSPRWTRSPERVEDRQQHSQQPEPRSARALSPTRPRSPAVHGTRGNCKGCGLLIKGKSISSADGRLTGRYHKPCFVCSSCQEPFTSSTFYVLDDRPYCELHYHKLNGSLCGSCGRGIEGQYLEDESTVKHHVGCFKCQAAGCGMALRNGYFEVGGKAYCEKDAWRLVGQPSPANGAGRPGPGIPGMGLPGGPRGPPPGAYGGGRFGPGPRPRMEKRMTRLGML